ncbi:hypothetical protein A3Q56_05261 [Intoshia linei]|uniref:Ras-associating domain-containing protein n=1 Tax=Intoshia linei TaxID=1819745 RepID=A0A177AY88_9BILA|nr:hypothetical protein A3Q56_05261 [Intoshia linei]
MNLNQDHNTLKKEIDEWNKNRIDLFEISIPNKDLEYFGVVRFYHQSNNTSTHSKCIRISSSWSTENIIHVLMEKFRPDMKMLSNEKHCLYEVHSNGDERMLQQDDKPLKVQLMWGRQDRDGRFIFKREKEINGSTFKRKLSKREKKQLKKQEKKDKLSSELPTKSSIAETHFSDIPDTNLHRTISNPETLVKRRRQTKIERILKNLNNLAMDSIAIKTKIYIGIQNYKGGIGSVTININPTDSTVVIIKKTLIALGLEPQDYFNYLLMKSLKVSRSKVKIIVDVADRPIGDMVNWSNENGKSHSQTTLSNLKNVKFTLKGATPALLMEMERFHDSVPSLENKFKSHNTIILLEIKLNPKYDVRKSDIKNAFISFGKAIELGCGKHSIGSSRKSDTNILNENRDNLILLDGSDIEKYHAKIIVTEDSVQVEPVLRNCLMYIKSNLVTERSLLKDGDIVCIGTNALFKVYDSRDQTIKSIAFLTAMMTQYQQKLYHSNGNASDKSSMSILSKPSLIENGSQHEHNIENVVHDAPQKYKYRKISKLPLILEFNHPDELISSVVWSINTQTVPFKHGPAYIFYLACRQFIENESLYVEELASFVHKICMAFSGIVEKSVNSSVNLAFWIANISEFLHFIKYDVDICRVVPTKLVLKLSQILETSFYHLIDQLQLKTEPSMLDFMDQSDADLSNGQYVENPNLLDGLLHLFSSTMPMLRRCRINAALAIQLFSQLFYFVNMWLFNKLVQCDPNYPLRCNRVWGSRLRRRIEKIEIWAEKQDQINDLIDNSNIAEYEDFE